jgi:hypothetical protein
MNVTLGSYYSLHGFNLSLTIHNFPNDYRPDIRTKALRYLFTHRRKDNRCPPIQHLINSTLNLFEEFYRKNMREHVREVVDIIGEFIPHRREEFFQRLRQIDEDILVEIKLREEKRAVEREQKRKDIKRTVYGDSQNVHNSSINQTVIKVLENLFDRYKQVITLDVNDEKNFIHKVSIVKDIETILINTYTENKELISSTIEYIIENTALFGKRNISMLDGYIALWLYITEHKSRKDLELRLLEEMKEMKKQCTTGHIARFMNVIQGFTDDENLMIRISNKDQCHAVITNYLTSELSKCDDEEVILGMTDGGSKFISFIKEIVNRKIPDWEKEYGKEMIPDIFKIINNFVKTEISFKSN